ncbi:DMT family transporter [Primorskyibacter sp. 2E233]|uniref:DMT family transporter n=1 Tax=Primorskyibacter sp. 2E233 TaxID=3413431 RepID=UPI003BF02225
MTPLHGIALKLSAVFVFTIMASLIKASSDIVPPGEAVFFRSFFAMPIIIAWLAARGDLSTGLKVQRPMGHVWRGLIGVSAMGSGFTALGLLPLPEVTALGYAAPLLTVIFAAIFLKERLRLFRMSAVGLGLIGVVVVLWPRLTLDGLDDAAALGVACILFSAVLRALAQIHIRRMVATEPTAAIVFWFSMTATLFSLLTIPFGWEWPGTAGLVQLISAGLIGGVGQILLTSSYRHAEAAVLAPFDYASILFAILFGYFFFDEVPTAMVLIGSGIVMLAGVIIIWRERQLGLKRGKARAGMSAKW